MDMNLAVLIAMLALMVGGALLLNFQIKHQAKKEQAEKKAEQKAQQKSAPAATGAVVAAE